MRRAIEISSSDAKIDRTGAERRNIFPSRLEKGTNVVFIFALEGKLDQRIRISARKWPPGLGPSKQLCLALTSSLESCDRHFGVKTP